MTIGSPIEPSFSPETRQVSIGYGLAPESKEVVEVLSSCLLHEIEAMEMTVSKIRMAFMGVGSEIDPTE